MITVTAPAAVHGDALTAELRAAGLNVRSVTLLRDELQLAGLAETDRQAAQQVVAAHVPPPPPPDPDEQFRAALTAATTVASLRDALLGKAGPGAQARRPGA